MNSQVQQSQQWDQVTEYKALAFDHHVIPPLRSKEFPGGILGLVGIKHILSKPGDKRPMERPLAS